MLAAITAELSASGANILDVSQKVLQEYFTVVLVADLPAGTDLGSVRDGLQSRVEAMGAARALAARGAVPGDAPAVSEGQEGMGEEGRGGGLGPSSPSPRGSGLH